MKKQFTYILVGVISLLAISACDKESHPPLRIVASPWPGYEPLYLARDLGYMDEDTVRLFELPSLDVVLESFRINAVDVAAMTMDEAIGLVDDGYDIRVVLVTDISNGGDAVLASPKIQKADDIRGAKISVVNVPVGFYVLDRFLEKNGIARESVSVFPMPDTHQQVFYREGKADLVVTYDPVKSHLMQDGMRTLFDSREMPDEIFDLLVIREAVYQERKPELCTLVNAWFKSLVYMQEYPEDTEKRISQRLKIPQKNYPEVMSGVIFPSREQVIGLMTNGGGLDKSWARLSDVMVRDGNIQSLTSMAGLSAPEIVACQD